MKTRYVIISPARNESALIELTINSVINQTIKPVEYIIVNDGSTDDTVSIVSKYSKLYPWIRICNLPDRGHHEYGSGVVRAFYYGFSNLATKEYDYIVKLDSDLSFNEYYFENLLREFFFDPRLGIISGQTYFLDNNNILTWEDAPVDHTRGASKVYNKDCFNNINGLVESVGWDNIDEVSARMKNWKTRSFPDYQIIHHRAVGSNGGFIKGNIRHGYTDYITGYHVCFFLIKSFYRLFTKPYFIGSLASFYGFFKNYFIGKDKVVSKAFCKFYRKEQLKKLRSKNFWNLYLEKYNVPWRLATVFSFLIYYSGTLSLYLFFRKKIFKRYRSIVLTYHKIDDYKSAISVSPFNFHKQVIYLSTNFRIISIDELIGLRNNSSKLKEDHVAISFDDGYSDNYHNAYPLLKEKKIPAIIFLISNYIGRPGMLSIPQVMEMQEDLISIGSHTTNHPVLSEIDIAKARSEISESKTYLEKLCKKPVHYFAYPKGKKKHFNKFTRAEVERSEYKACFTMINNTIDAEEDILELPRLGIRNCPHYVFKIRVSGILENIVFTYIKRIFSIA